MTNIYEMKEPTAWVTSSERFSFSSLRAITSCPRKWQLLNSRWGEFERFPERPHPKAIEGTIVHQAIDRLFRALARRGMPQIGSDLFHDAVLDVGFWDFFGQEVDRWNECLARHPRAGPYFVLRTPAGDLASRAIGLVRERYVARAGRPWPTSGDGRAASSRPPRLAELLRSRGALTEVRIEHPSLPFVGVIDLVESVGGEVRIVDFKTGSSSGDEGLQLRQYALLWWRHIGTCPTSVSVQHLDSHWDSGVAETELARVEKALEVSISDARGLLELRPAPARPGQSCGSCPVRARCNEGWRVHVAGQIGTCQNVMDAEVIVAAAPAAAGFLGRSAGGRVDVVYEAPVAARLPTIVEGSRLRLIDALARDDGRTLEIRPWTEVYG